MAIFAQVYFDFDCFFNYRIFRIAGITGSNGYLFQKISYNIELFLTLNCSLYLR